WAEGVELGRELLRLQLRGARGAERPRLPGGQRPYVRAAVGPDPLPVVYDAEERALRLGTGRIAPVPVGAWEFRVSGVRVLELWCERRTAACAAEAGGAGLEAVRARGWLQEWTSELLELVSLLALLAGLRPRQEALAAALAAEPGIGADELRAAGVLPVPESARRPASVLDHREEGPDGQFALL
ncbi:DNA methyltransferase, partial [Streptomyces sp. OfavH-34-F]|uniref:type ISP restriction/modification enzyme n=1 Tax=Streptomyces sp. OfavH-34-F TaxID=2917760 RepID=UPI0027E54AB1